MAAPGRTDVTAVLVAQFAEWMDWAANGHGEPTHAAAGIAAAISRNKFEGLRELQVAVALYRGLKCPGTDAALSILVASSVVPSALLFAPPPLSPFIQRLLFDVVSVEAAECAIFGASAFDAVTAVPRTLPPNPLLRLAACDGDGETKLKRELLQFLLLPASNRRLLLAELLELSSNCPARFAPSTAVGLALFLEFYVRQAEASSESADSSTGELDEAIRGWAAILNTSCVAVAAIHASIAVSTGLDLRTAAVGSSALLQAASQIRMKNK